MVNINCPTAIYKNLSYILPLPGGEPLTRLTFQTSWSRSAHPACSPAQNVCFLHSHERDVVSCCGFAFEHKQQKLSFLIRISDTFPSCCRCSAGEEDNQLDFVACTDCVILYNGNKSVQIRKAKTFSSASYVLYKKPPTTDFLPQT